MNNANSAEPEVLKRFQSRTPTSARYKRVQSVLERDSAFSIKLGPKDYPVSARFGETLLFSKEVIAVTNALHAEGIDAIKLPQAAILKTAASLLLCGQSARREPTPSVAMRWRDSATTQPSASSTSAPESGQAAAGTANAIATAVLRLAEITLDRAIQCRVEVSRKTVAEYAERILAGDRFPPLVVFQIGETYVLADGWHRYEAAQTAGLESFAVQVRQGTRKDAILFAIDANGAHGLRITNKDKRRFVALALQECPELSDHLVAEKCRVSQPFVSRLRRSQLKTVISCRTGRDGRKRRQPRTKTSASTPQHASATKACTPTDGAAESSSACRPTNQSAENGTGPGEYELAPELEKVKKTAQQAWQQVETQARKLRQNEQPLFWEEFSALENQAAKTRISPAG